jgi:class 3 adenylate cyclase
MEAASSLYVIDPEASRFVGGGLPEVETLLGSPLPVLPPAQLEDGREVLRVRFHPGLRTVLSRFLLALLRQFEAERTGALAPEYHKEQSGYESMLLRILGSTRAADRRMGLLNLHWLAHARDVAGCIADLEKTAPFVSELKVLLPSYLGPVYRRLEAMARRTADARDPELAALRGGGGEDETLVAALTEDGYAFTESSIEGLDLADFIASKKRLGYSAELFSEISQVLVRETESRLHSGDAGLLARISRHMPLLNREQLEHPEGLLKVALNAHVMTYLFADAWSTGPSLLASATIRKAVKQHRPSEVVSGFLEIAEGLKRFEILCHLGARVKLGQGFAAEEELDGRMRGGARVYEFGESAQVLNNAVNATVLFLDLRGFTQTSEGQISERDLTRSLYEVFDAFAAVVRRFGGTVDKFLGDGMMVTFGTSRADPGGPVSALRAAILCQERLHQLREQSRSDFRMGVSIHYGRVYIARFLAGERSTHVTVIGRNVNLAGRLSSCSKKASDEDEPTAGPAESAPALRVSLDEDGALMNEGIVLSRAALVQLQSHLSLESTQDRGDPLMNYFDAALSRRVVIRYVGDAKFKGVRASFPVFEVWGDEAVAAGREALCAEVGG